MYIYIYVRMYCTCIIQPFSFPECVAKVPVSLWGWRVCSLDVAFTTATVRNCLQPFATVCNRSQPFARGRYGRAYGKFCNRGHFWRFHFHMSRSLVSRGRRGTSWHSDVFRNVSKVVVCGRRNTFAPFSEDEFQFSWQVQHSGRDRLHFAWQAQHFRGVVLWFCESHCQAASCGDNVQILWQAWHFVRCAENWWKPGTKHRFWGCKFSGSRENS